MIPLHGLSNGTRRKRGPRFYRNSFFGLRAIQLESNHISIIPNSQKEYQLIRVLHYSYIISYSKQRVILVIFFLHTSITTHSGDCMINDAIQESSRLCYSLDEESTTKGTLPMHGNVHVYWNTLITKHTHNST